MLHIGGLRTALYNYLFARRHGGDFLLRIEDTDQQRFVEGAEDDILGSLAWAGLTYDEGPDRPGSVGPYRQSERSELYGRYAQQLLDAGHAYYAFDTPEELDARREAREGSPFRYDASTRMDMTNSLTLGADEVARRIERGDPYVVRLKVPEGGSVAFDDLIRGRVTFGTAEVDDQVLVKSDGLPTYHLANVVDDHLMGITHVIRGEEWLPSTPKHVLLYGFFGWAVPQMAHLPLILSPSGGKLSKRKAEKAGIGVFVKDYREQGYEAQALVNFLAFLGWNPGDDRELFTLDELAEVFSIDRVGSAGVQFSQDKLTWFNEQYVRALTPDELAARARPFVEARGYQPSEAYLAEVAALMQERITFPADLVAEAPYFFEEPTQYDEKAVAKRWKDDSAELLRAYADRVEALAPFDGAAVEEALKATIEERGVGMGKLMLPVRLALTGVTSGPGVYDMIVTLGQKRSVARMRRAADTLG